MESIRRAFNKVFGTTPQQRRTLIWIFFTTVLILGFYLYDILK